MTATHCGELERSVLGERFRHTLRPQVTGLKQDERANPWVVINVSTSKACRGQSSNAILVGCGVEEVKVGSIDPDAGCNWSRLLFYMYSHAVCTGVSSPNAMRNGLRQGLQTISDYAARLG